ncbi:MAG: histidine kinase dimerization/phospho-acceptor domain-containing protein, partial [Gemmatimonadota bacterium]|nr:histidine kinase dimerization/phospho-acceptor domain-containing protein [Gemmatimonadota bacterium]
QYSREIERLNNELDEKSSQLESEGKTHPGYNRFLAIGEVAARFNHDLNNLLTIVMGNAQLLRDDLEGADEIIVKKVDNIISESRRIAQIAMEIRRTGKKFNKKDLQAGSPEKRDS